tara:strand:+ start:547 stop:852 length:306 start_codon:yes stop_codon:yes gene_type:complete
MNDKKNKNDLKVFFIKLISIIVAVIICFNVIFNLIFADKIDNINEILSLNEKENRDILKDKIRLEIKRSLKKEKILNDEDKILLQKLYLKLKKELKEIENE